MKSNALGLAAALLLLGMTPAMACGSGEVIYEDAFDEEDSAWEFDGNAIKYENGMLLLSPPLKYNLRMQLNQADVYDDVDFCVDMTFAKNTNLKSTMGGLMFWAKDYGEFYALFVDPNGNFSIQRQKKRRWLDVVKWREASELKKGEGVVNNLRVAIVGKKGILFINGKKIMTFKGRPPKDGMFIGIVGQGPKKAPRSVMSFDNFKALEATPSATLSSATPAAAPANSAATAISADGKRDAVQSADGPRAPR